MYPRLAPGERVLFDTLAYRLERPQRGDIVLARHPARPSLKLVKRVAAIPGDKVTAQGDRWLVEDESYPDASPDQRDVTALARVWTLRADEYFLVGDAPDLSTDARHFGPVRRGDILGRAWMVYWPASKMRVLRGASAHLRSAGRS